MSPDTQAIIDSVQQGFDRFGKTVYAGMARIFGSLAGRNEEPFVYNLRGGASGGDGYLTLAATIGSTVTGTIHIGQDADFVASNFHAVAVTASTGVIMPPLTTSGPSFSALIRNLGTDRQYSNVDGHNECLFGLGRESVRFTKNWLIRRNADIQIKLTNLQAVSTQVWISLVGYKIFDPKALDLTGQR